MHWTDVNMVVQVPDGSWKAITTKASSCGISATRAIILVDNPKNREMALC